MVDAILLKHIYEREIDPLGPDAPKSVVDAVRKLVNLQGSQSGALEEVDDQKYLREYAEKNLIIGVTSGSASETKPCFTFVDAGEGQIPKEFSSTFLSLSSGRKKEIPFVQGKYNMGSSGVLSYCGRCWYKLIVSRRYDKFSPWGWTLVRRRPNAGTPIAEYLMLDSKTPRFKENRIFPMRRNDREIDDFVSRDYGTIIKLYSYEFGRSANFRTIREALNENLVSTVLPFRLIDYRNKPNKARGGRRALGIDERTVNGMIFQLMRIDDSEDDDGERISEKVEKIHVGDIRNSELGYIRIQAVPVPRESPGWLNPGRNNSRIYHAVNGQVQFKQGRGYLSQKCKLPGLKDRIVIIVDASEMLESAHNDVWKGDRETIRETEFGKLYEKEVRDAIRECNALKEFERRVAMEETERLSDETKTKLFQNIVDSDPNIAQLLPTGAVVRLPNVDHPSTKGESQYVGKYNPTFVKLRGQNLRQNGIDVPLSGARKVGFDTDAMNDWLIRPDSKGEVRIGDNAIRAISLRAALHDGRLTINFKANSLTAALSAIFNTELILTSDTMEKPLRESIRIRIIDRRPLQPGGGGGRRRQSGRDDGTGGAEERGLPKWRWLTQNGRKIDEIQEESDNWPEGFTDQDGGLIKEISSEEKIYKINYDNAHFRHFLKIERGGPAKRRVIIEQYRLSMQVLMMGFEDAYNRMPDVDKEKLGEHLDRFRRLASQGAATVVMSIAQTVNKMINVGTIADPDD